MLLTITVDVVSDGGSGICGIDEVDDGRELRRADGAGSPEPKAGIRDDDEGCRKNELELLKHTELAVDRAVGGVACVWG